MDSTLKKFKDNMESEKENKAIKGAKIQRMNPKGDTSLKTLIPKKKKNVQ